MTVAYLMEDDREADRLVAKVDADRWVTDYLAPVMRPGASVLDVGAGPGHIALAVQRRCPDARVVAFDGNADRLTGEAASADLDPIIRQWGDARDLPFPDGAFDLVYSRLLLQYVGERDRAIAEMVRVTKPGGVVVLYDLDGQLIWHDPITSALQSSIETVLDGLAKTGFDPHTGRRLYGLARRAGLTDIQVRVDPYHLIAGAVEPAERQRWELKLDIARPAIIAALGSTSDADKIIRDFLAHLDDEESLTYSVAFTVTGVRIAG